MREPVWIERRVIIAIHERLLAEHGGPSGLRDEGTLESALARPRHLFAYQKCDLSQLAAAYCTGIVRGHPFVDGNKRTGFMAGYVFLVRNGMRLNASEADAARVVLDLASGSIDEPAFATWLRAKTRPVPRTR